jgi:hypothetical protein
MASSNEALTTLINSIRSSGNALTAVFTGVTSKFREAGNWLTGAFRSFTSTLFTGLKLVVGGIVAAIGGLLLAIKSSTSAMTEFARNALSIRANTGMGYGAAGALLARNRAFGISGAETASAFGNAGMNPLLGGMRGLGSGFGSTSDPRFFENAARSYQSQATNPLGRMLANNRLDSLFGGQAPDSVRNLVNMDPNKLRAQGQWQSNMQGRLGVTGGDIRKYAEDLPLLTNRIGSFIDMVKIKFAATLMPGIERGLTVAVNFISKNAGSIADAIKTAGRWLVVEAPVMVLKFGARVLEVFGNFLGGAGAFLEGLANNSSGILKVLDMILNGLRMFVSGVAGVGAGIAQAVSNVTGQIKSGTGLPGVAQKIGGAITGDPNNSLGNQVKNTAVGVGATAGGTWLTWQALKTGAKLALGGGGTGAAVTGLGVASRVGVAGALGLGAGVAAYEMGRRIPGTPQYGLPSTYQIALGAFGVNPNAPAGGGAAPIGGGPGASNSPWDAGMRAFNGTMGFLPQSNLEGAYSGRLSELAMGASGMAKRGSEALLGYSKNLDGMADNYQKEILSELKNISKNTKDSAAWSEGLAKGWSATSERMIALAANLRAKDAVNNHLRIPGG